MQLYYTEQDGNRKNDTSLVTIDVVIVDFY